MHEIVINNDYGGFSLSDKAVKWLNAHGKNMEDGYDSISRMDPLLIECVKTLGKEADGDYAHLQVVMFDGNKYRIIEYDGWESLETPDTINWETVED